MRHTFTTSESRQGGWTRARQHAAYRRLNPSPLEAKVQSQLQSAGYSIYPEYEILTDFPQWIDIYAIHTQSGRNYAIEVDGSHGWHNCNGKYRTKMARYDEAKARWCNQQGIPLIYVNAHMNILELIGGLK